MNQYLNLFCLLFSLWTPLLAQTDLEKFEKANQLYQNEDFEQSIEIYNELLEESYISSDLHYNLGNAYFRTNKIANAILHYEKSLKIDPSNEDALHNLEYANARTVDKIETPVKLFFYRWWESIIHSFSSTSWSFFVLIFLFIGVCALAIYFFFANARVRKISFYSGLIALILSSICWIIADSHFDSLKKEEFAIIMSPTVDINSSPSEGSSRLFVLHEGSKVQLKEKSNDWYEVKLPNGNSGWIKASELEVI